MLEVVACVLWDAGAHVYASDAPAECLLEAPPPMPSGVDVLVYAHPEQPAELRKLTALARHVVARDGHGAVILLQTPPRARDQDVRAAELAQIASDLAAAHIELHVVGVRGGTQSDLNAVLGTIVVLASPEGARRQALL
jgi:hypothetical protein